MFLLVGVGVFRDVLLAFLQPLQVLAGKRLGQLVNLKRVVYGLDGTSDELRFACGENSALIGERGFAVAAREGA